jgi:glycosyltransferase involved in cell wall biosynthesis
MELVSIIIPIKKDYGSDVDMDYVNTTINSLASQTYKDLEIIVVSNENDYNWKALNELPKKFPIVKVVSCQDTVTKGLGSFLNSGLNNANGDYLAFATTDSIYDESAFEKYYNTITKDNSDIVIGESNFNFEQFANPNLLMPGLDLFNSKLELDTGIYDNRVILKKFVEKEPDTLAMLGGKLFKKDTFRGRYFSPTFFFADYFLLSNLYIGSPKISIINENLYTEYKESNSFSTFLISIDHCRDYFNIHKSKIIKIYNSGVFDANFDFDRYILSKMPEFWMSIAAQVIETNPNALNEARGAMGWVYMNNWIVNNNNSELNLILEEVPNV